MRNEHPILPVGEALTMPYRIHFSAHWRGAERDRMELIIREVEEAMASERTPGMKGIVWFCLCSDSVGRRHYVVSCPSRCEKVFPATTVEALVDQLQSYFMEGSK